MNQLFSRETTVQASHFLLSQNCSLALLLHLVVIYLILYKLRHYEYKSIKGCKKKTTISNSKQIILPPAAIDLTEAQTRRQTDANETFTFSLLRPVKTIPVHINLMLNSTFM